MLKWTNEPTGGIPGRHGIPFCPTVFFTVLTTKITPVLGHLMLFLNVEKLFVCVFVSPERADIICCRARAITVTK
jgi:hypothetical protein